MSRNVKVTQQVVRVVKVKAVGAQGAPGIPSGMQAAVYDPTSKVADAFDMENMAEGASAKILSAAERTLLNNTSGANSGDQDLSGKENVGVAASLDAQHLIDFAHALIAHANRVHLDTMNAPYSSKENTGRAATLDGEHLGNFDHDSYDAHLIDTTNPHSVTAGQAGADPAGSAGTVQGNLDTHEADMTNPHAVTAVQAGADPAGTGQGVMDTHEGAFVHNDIAHANRAALDVVAGTNTGDQDVSPYDAHLANTSNPHSVTPVQIGLGPENDVEFRKITQDSAVFDPLATPPAAPVQGQMWWNTDEETLDVKLGAATLQVGQEIHYHVRNDTGVTISDGTPVMAVGTIGALGLIQVAPMDGTVPSLAKFMLGVTTESILNGENGKVTYLGKIRGLDTTGTLSFGGLETWLDGDVLYVDPHNTGYLTNVEPEPPHIYMPVSFDVYSHATEGVLSVRITPLDESILRTSRIAITSYSSGIPNNTTQNIHGSIDPIVTGINISAGDVDLAVSGFGQGKIVFASNGVAETGVIRITGTSIDRDTGVETPADTELVTVDITTTDGNGADSNGVATYDLVDAFISTKWWTGEASISLHQESGTLTDIDAYQCSYEQFGDARSVNVRILDMTIQALATNGALSNHAYTVIKGAGSRVNIQEIPDTAVTKIAWQTNKWYRIRRGALDVPLDGRTDGMFLNITYGGSPTKFANSTIKVWVDVSP